MLPWYRASRDNPSALHKRHFDSSLSGKMSRAVMFWRTFIYLIFKQHIFFTNVFVSSIFSVSNPCRSSITSSLRRCRNKRFNQHFDLVAEIRHGLAASYWKTLVIASMKRKEQKKKLTAADHPPWGRQNLNIERTLYVFIKLSCPIKFDMI